MIKPSMNPRVASNDHAMQSFRFFERETVPILSEVFGKDLWTVTLPRAAMHCPLIWNAAVALGSAHESHYLMTRGPGLSQAKLEWTFEQYNRAIRSFASTHAAGKRDDKAAIVASILFMVFEVCGPVLLLTPANVSRYREASLVKQSDMRRVVSTCFVNTDACQPRILAPALLATSSHVIN